MPHRVYKIIVRDLDDSITFEADLNEYLEEQYEIRTGPEIRYAPFASDKEEGVLFAFLSKVVD